MSRYSDSISVRFPPEVRAAIAEAARVHGVTQADIIRRYVRRGLTLEG